MTRELPHRRLAEMSFCLLKIPKRVTQVLIPHLAGSHGHNDFISLFSVISGTLSLGQLDKLVSNSHLAFKEGVLVNKTKSTEYGKLLALKLGILCLKSEHSLENNPTEKHLEQKHAVILHNN